MPLRMHLELVHLPQLDADELLAILRGGLGDACEVYKPGRFQVPDVIVKRSESEGAAVQIVQQRLRKRKGESGDKTTAQTLELRARG